MRAMGSRHMAAPWGGPRDRPNWCWQPHRLRLHTVRGFRQRLLGLHAWAAWGGSPWGLCLPACRAIHTGALAQPVDVVFMGAQGGVLRVLHQLPPNRWVACREAFAVIELPAAYCRQPGWDTRIQVAWALRNIVM